MESKHPYEDSAVPQGKRGKWTALGMILFCLVLFILFIQAIDDTKTAARRAQCINNLKQIGLAIHEYGDVSGYLPAAAITDNRGKPLLSWRVALLPYLEQGALYERFHLDEPWDSPHNLTLLDKMPGFYRCPSDESLKLGMTGYQVVVGRDTPFTPDYEAFPFRLPHDDPDFPDSLSSTLLVGESDHAVPWTKPEDIPFEIALHTSGLCGLHGTHDRGFSALMADGSVHFLKGTIDPKIIHALLTRNGRENVIEGGF